jgi:hypothetical protein
MSTDVGQYGSAVFPDHAKLLAASGITPEVAHARLYRSADSKEQLRRSGFTPAQHLPPGLVLPTWSPLTRSIAGYQLRPDRPRVDQKRGRVVKYETAALRPVVVDAHPFTWKSLGDPATPLFVTEGIRKADAAVSVGLCCVGLLGVWNWRGSNDKGGTTALPEWEAIALNDHRRVYIVFDSDAMVKPEVHGALVRLKSFLEARGAEVFVIYLPSGDGGVKVGLDDFLVAGRTKDDLLALASPELRPLPVEDGEDLAEPEDTFEDVPEEEGAVLLDEVAGFVSGFVAFPRPEYSSVVALWVAHAHAIVGFESTPRLAVLSPEKQSGKTRLLEVIELLVPRPMLAVNCSAAALYRTVDASQRTVLLDEVDTIYGPKSGDHEELRSLLNAGHRRGAIVPRCGRDGTKFTLEQFQVFAAVVLAGIGDLPDTVMDRAIILRMRRRAKSEKVEPFRRRLAEQDGKALCRRLAAWAKRNAEPLATNIPVMPDGIVDRPADVWEPLLAVADVASGHWPKTARNAAIALVAAQREEPTSLGVRLLSDIRSVFPHGTERLGTDDLLGRLNGLAEAPWADLNGKALDARSLAWRLQPYGVKPKNVRVHDDGGPTGRVAKGYERAAFVDPWGRYLPPEGVLGPDEDGVPVSPPVAEPAAAATRARSATDKGSLTCDVTHVADVADLQDRGGDAGRPDHHIKAESDRGSSDRSNSWDSRDGDMTLAEVPLGLSRPAVVVDEGDDGGPVLDGKLTDAFIDADRGVRCLFEWGLEGAKTGHRWFTCDACGQLQLLRRDRFCGMTPGCAGRMAPEAGPTFLGRASLSLAS